MQIEIYQGRAAPPNVANITIVIDVIRAFTVAYYAFLQGVTHIFLAETVEQAFLIKRKNPEYLLAGEVDGIAIKGFDLDNSPITVLQTKLDGKTLVLKTTNGVQATLSCLSSEHIFVTGFTNAKKTADFVREKMLGEENNLVHLIASHPSGDDDLACAEYIKCILEASYSISPQNVAKRIKQSHVAEKFLNVDNPAFAMGDVFYCLKEKNTNFVMKVNNKCGKIPMIERVYV